MKCKVSGKEITPFMSFGKMPMANGFLEPEEFNNEFFYELEVGFSEDNFLFQVNDHPKSNKIFNDKYPFYTHQLKIIGMVAEWDGELQIEPTSIKVINENYEFQSNEVSISSILQGNHDGIIITFSGIITDYINLIEHEGPHIIKISEDINKSSLEIAIWDDGWTSFHQELITKCPFYTHELKVTGMVDRYEGEIQINGSSIQIINENHEFQPTIESISSVYQGNHNNKIITCKGLLVDYFDIT